MSPVEGVIQFELEHLNQGFAAGPGGQPSFAEPFCSLVAWREILARSGLVGQDPGLYEGYGYGNASVRVGRRSAGRGRRTFLITGTQTSGKRQLRLADCALVERWSTTGNRVESRGYTRPSSEALSHAAVYDVAPQARAVLHAHSPVLWRHAPTLRLPITDPAAANGTPEMAVAISRCYAEGLFAERRILAMGGHEDGILAFGRTVEEAGVTLITWFARALATECRC